MAKKIYKNSCNNLQSYVLSHLSYELLKTLSQFYNTLKIVLEHKS